MSTQPKLHILFHRDEISATVKRLATEIRRDYQYKNPLLVGNLKGSFVFLADLIRHLDFPLEVDFIHLSSYGSGTESSGKIRVVQPISSTIKGRDVLLIEDIVDTGICAAFIMEYLKKKKPASLKFCTLTEKPARRTAPVAIDYLGFTVPNKFIVGYGIDWDEKYRYLPDIGYLEWD